MQAQHAGPIAHVDACGNRSAAACAGCGWADHAPQNKHQALLLLGTTTVGTANYSTASSCLSYSNDPTSLAHFNCWAHTSSRVIMCSAAASQVVRHVRALAAVVQCPVVLPHHTERRLRCAHKQARQAQAGDARAGHARQLQLQLHDPSTTPAHTPASITPKQA